MWSFVLNVEQCIIAVRCICYCFSLIPLIQLLVMAMVEHCLLH